MNTFKTQEYDDGYNMVYAKKGKSPKRFFCETRKDVIEFLIRELNNIDFLSINDVVIDSNKLVNSNIKLSRLLKLMKADEL